MEVETTSSPKEGKMAKPYETVVVVDAMIPEESIASEFEAIGKLIESQGKVLKLDRWGKRKLAYTIRKRTHGEYAVFYYEANEGLPAEIDKRFRINENILRWLTVADSPLGIPPDKVEGEMQPQPAEPSHLRSHKGDD
jgi:small subunit ribosomal protein S6